MQKEERFVLGADSKNVNVKISVNNLYIETNKV